MSEYEDASFNEYVRTEIAKRDAEIERLKREIAELKKQKGISSAREGLTFNDHFGIWADESGKHFCPKCVAQEKRNQLKIEQRGWRCTVCSTWYSNPDKPLPGVMRTRGGGGSWMGS